MPKHRHDTAPDSFPSEARCTRTNVIVHRCFDTGCPRHHAESYADHYARHATDSLAPLGTLPTRWMP